MQQKITMPTPPPTDPVRDANRSSPILAPREGVLIVNTRSRQGREQFEPVQTLLREGGITLRATYPLDNPSDLKSVLQRCVAEGARLVIVGGGDGSYRVAANVLVHTDVVLGVLPLGTVNDFARNLNILPNIQAACKVIVEGHTEDIALGKANETYFVITASLGFSAQTQHALTPLLKKVFGRFGYLMASLKVLRRARPLEITVRSEQGEEHLQVMQAGVIHGHSWMGGKCEIPGIDLESGRLAFYAVPPQPGFAYLRLARRLMRWQFFHTPGLRAFKTQEVTIQTRFPQPTVLDGDLEGETPVRFHIVPHALRVCVPKDFHLVNNRPPAVRTEP